LIDTKKSWLFLPKIRFQNQAHGLHSYIHTLQTFDFFANSRKCRQLLT
jgi:hypothetical protein